MNVLKLTITAQSSRRRYARDTSKLIPVTALIADDNWGNLVAVLPDDRRKPKAGGIYYHADCKSPS